MTRNKLPEQEPKRPKFANDTFDPLVPEIRRLGTPFPEQLEPWVSQVNAPPRSTTSTRLQPPPRPATPFEMGTLEEKFDMLLKIKSKSTSPEPLTEQGRSQQLPPRCRSAGL